MNRSVNPFRFTGPLQPAEMIGRDGETKALLEHARGGHMSRLEAPRRYGKTSLLGRVAAEAAAEGMATALVDLEDVLSLGALVTRIERGYSRGLGGGLRRWVDRQLGSWELGLSLGAVGFGVTLKANPGLDPEPILLRLLSLPEQIHRKRGVRTLIVLDEVQGLLRVDGAAGIVRSVIQHQADVASYVFAGSAPSLMRKLFDDPDGPFLSQGVPVPLAPLDAEELGEAVERRFRETGRDPGEALGELIHFSRGHPQRSMQLAHHLWQVVPRRNRGSRRLAGCPRRRARRIRAAAACAHQRLAAQRAARGAGDRDRPRLADLAGHAEAGRAGAQQRLRRHGVAGGSRRGHRHPDRKPADRSAVGPLAARTEGALRP